MKTPSAFSNESHETIKYLTPTQLSAILSAARSTSIRDYTILLTAYSHGMRISEISRVQLQDYDPATHRLKMRRVKNGHSPTYRVSEDVHKAITQWLKIRGGMPGPLFASRRTKLNLSQAGADSTTLSILPLGITKRTLHNLFVKYATMAGLPKDLRHFHTLRHSCAVHMVDKNIPMVQIQDWLGHRNIASTSVYAKVSDTKRDETAREFYAGRESEIRKEDKVQWSKDRKRR